jgi:hypothetical protein
VWRWPQISGIVSPHQHEQQPHLGHAIAQALSHWPLNMEAWVHARVSPHGICGGQSGIPISFKTDALGLLY